MKQTQAVRYKNLLFAEFQTRLAQESQGVLLDVRTPDEFHSGCIPHALNMDVTDNNFYDAITGLDKTKIYFVYCRSGSRSGQACLLLAEQGFTAYNLMGGIGSWQGKIVTP